MVSTSSFSTSRTTSGEHDMKRALTLLGSQHEALKKLLFPESGNEGAALLELGRSSARDPWTGELEERFLLRRIVQLSPADIISATPVGITYSTTPILRLAKEVGNKFSLGVIHSHRGELAAFSDDDNVADLDALSLVFNRNGAARPGHLSAVMLPSGKLIARAYERDLKPEPLNGYRIIGDQWTFERDERATVSGAFDRQVRLFGPALTQNLRRLRVGIVGCGGTGSAVASLLARMGVGRLVFIDADRVEESNLNRLHFSKRADADAGRFKANVLAEAIAELSLGVRTEARVSFVDDAPARDALKACDVIFGCTDDHLGRNALNRVAHFYYIPVIDMGVLIEPTDQGYDTFDGRVTVVQPGYPCQLCRKLISSEKMRMEALIRADPRRYEAERRAGYVANVEAPSPVVVTFTTEVACMAVNELLQRLVGFKDAEYPVSERIRRLNAVKAPDLIASGKQQLGCPLCGRRRYDGRGDMEPFLDQA
jgi:molybdopterin/thiamine biosynthesis adenylyltransferase